MTDGCRFADLAPLSADLEGTGSNQDYMIGDQLTSYNLDVCQLITYHMILAVWLFN